MARGSLRRYDVQASYSCALALISLVPFFGAAVLVVWKYKSDLSAIVYNAEGPFIPLFLGCLAVALLAAGLGFVLGWNSAGQRRNHRSAQSWIGFLIGGGVLTFSFVLFLAFYMLRLGITVGK